MEEEKQVLLGKNTPCKLKSKLGAEYFLLALLILNFKLVLSKCKFNTIFSPMGVIIYCRRVNHNNFNNFKCHEDELDIVK